TDDDFFRSTAILAVGPTASCPLPPRQLVNYPLGRTPALFRPGGEDGLEIWALFFPGDYMNINAFEAGVFQKLVQLHFGETEPVYIRHARHPPRITAAIT